MLKTNVFNQFQNYIKSVSYLLDKEVHRNKTSGVSLWCWISCQLQLLTWGPQSRLFIWNIFSLSFSISACLTGPVSLPVSLCLPISLSVSLSLSLSFSLSLSLFFSLSLFLSLSLSLSLCPYLSLSICLSLSLSLSILLSEDEL